MHKLTRLTTRTLALLFALCATGGAWSDPVLTMSGYVSVDSENPSVAFTGVTLDELMTKYKLSGDMGGGHALPVGAATACIAKLNDGALTVQFQRIDDGVCKCVYVKFTEDTSVSPTQIKAVATAAKYANYTSKFGTDADGFANSKTPVDNDSAGGYGICNLELTPRAYSADTININFTHDSANLTTLVEQGLAAYAVSGILWDNISGGNGSLATVHKTASDGTYSTVAGASITVSGALGSYRCNNLTAENDLRHGYVDDASSVTTPQIAIAGIPFDSYRVVVYHACEAANTAFGYDTIGGVKYKVANGVTIVASGTDIDAWGDSGAKDSAEAIAVGVNCLVSPVISGSSLTIVGHWLSGGRAGIAAIQIVEADSTPVTYSASISSNTAWSDVSWADSKTWSNDDDAIATISVANSPTLTFDGSVTACGIILESAAGGVTLTGTKPTAVIDYSGIAGEVTYGFLCSDPIYSRAAGLKLTGGAGTSESAIAFTPAGGSMTFDGSGETPYYLSFGNSGTSTAINFNDAEVVTSSFDLGTASAIVGGDSDITATRVILSQGDNSRIASLTVKDSAKLTVTGTTNADQNTASIMFGHWNGPSTFTLQDSAEFVSEGADVLVGKTGNNHTINIDGGVFNVRGIWLSSNAGGTNALNLNGGELKLGATGIGAYNTSKAMTITVGGNAKITANATVVPIDKAVTVSDGQTLTVDATNGRVAFSSLTLVGTAKLVVVGGSVNLREHTIPNTATVTVQDGGVVKYARDSAGNTYYTIAEALAAINDDDTLEKRITLVGDTDEDFEFSSEGFVLNTNGTAYSGTISGVSGIGVSESEGVYTSISNTASTWTNDAGDGLWENAQNWSTKSVPTSSTTVTFNADAIVNTPYDSAVAYGIVISEGHTLTLRRAGETPGTAWSTITVGAGAVSGNGTIKLVAAGINKSVSSFTIGANIEFENDGSHDSFLGETVSGSFVINGTVTGTGYFQVKTSTTFNGNVTIPSGSLIQVNSWTYNLGNNVSLYGAGTLKFNAVDPSTSMRTALKDKDKWTGVCEIYNKSINDINANNYGNVNSTVRYNGVTGYSAYSTGNTLAVGNVKCIDIGASGLTYNNGFSSNNFGYTYACALTGTGTITFGSTYGGSGTYTFTGDASAFAGTISYGSIVADKKAAIVFNSTDNASPTVGKGQLGVAAGTTLGLAGFTGTVVGSGTIAWTTPDPSSSVKPTFDSSWTGTVVLPSKQGSMTVNLAWWGVTGSRIKVMGFQGTGTGNSVKIGTDAVAATVELAGNVRLQNGDDDTTYTIAALTGTGDFNTTLTGTPGSTTNMRSTYSFTKLTDYTGTISTVTPDAGEGKTWWTKVAIGTVNVSSLDLTSSSPIVKLGGTHNLVSIPTLTVNDVATSHELYQGADGNLYVKVASVTVNDVTTYYPTLQAAADAAMAAGGETITFTRIDSEAGTSLPGWTYEDGVFTRTGYAYNVTTETEYSTLAGAVAAASNGDTIQLMYANSETAVDTTDKDFIFDENGYAFSGTWTGSGRIVLSAAPSTTTWSSARFVAEGWTGTVTLDWGTIDYRDDSVSPKRGDIAGIVNKYGIAASTVEIGQNSKTEGNCYFNGNTTPKLKVSGYLYINDGSSTTKRTIGNVCGDGVFVFGDKADTVNYGITNLDDWNGILTNKSANVTVGTVTRGNGTIYCTNKPTTAPTFTDTEGNRWTGRFIVGWNQTSSAAFAANSYGISGSIVEIPEGITIVGYAPNSANTTATIAPAIDVKGSLKFDNGYSGGVVNINKVTGSGTLDINCIYTYNITTLENWNGTITYAKSGSTASGTISNIVSGSGTISSDHAFSASSIGSGWQGKFEIKWTHSSGNLNINNYGVANSSVVIGKAVTGGYVGTQNAATTYNPKLILDNELKLNSGYGYDSDSNALSKKNTFDIVSGDANLTFAFTSGYSGYWIAYQVNTFDNYGGTITLPERNEIVIGKLKYPSSASASLVPDTKLISISAHSNSKILNSSLGDVTTAGVPVYVDNADSGMKAVYKTDGLYIAVAQVGSAYYATIQDAITAAGGGSVTVTLLVDTDEDVALAYGQVLDTGSTTYTGTVSAADSSANVVHTGTTYSVRYGTIFSVY